MGEAIKDMFKHGYILMTGGCLMLIAEKIGLFNALAGLLAWFVMAE